MPRTHTPKEPAALVTGLLALLILAAPYGYAATTGEPSTLTGFAALQDRASSAYCARGLTPTGIFFFLEVAVLLAVVAFVHWRRPGWGAGGAVLRRNGWGLVVFAALAALPFVLAWRTDSSVCVRGETFFWESVFIEVFILAVLAISYNLLFGFIGIVSFGHAVFFGAGAYLVGIFMKLAGWPWWAAIGATLLVGVAIALLEGFVGLRIKGLYFALFTLAFAEVFYLLAGNRILVEITGAEDGFTFTVPDWLNATKNRFFFYYLAMVFLVAAYVMVRRLMDSPTGQVFRAIRDNEDRAQMLGFDTLYFKLIALVVAGLLATGAGILRGLVFKGASPNLLGLGFTFDPLLATIIGGTGTFAGPVLGAVGLHLLEQYLRDTVLTLGALQINIGQYWSLILGAIFIVIVLAFPRGLVGTLRRMKQ